MLLSMSYKELDFQIGILLMTMCGVNILVCWPISGVPVPVRGVKGGSS
jgi:hypothetical protein